MGVPKGWESKKLGEVCKIIGGGTPSKSNPAFYVGDIPWATVRDMRKEVVQSTEFSISLDAVEKSSTNIIPANNVIIATRVGLGKVSLVFQDTAINQDLKGIIPLSLKIVSVKYLFLWLKSIAFIIEKEGVGATVKGVKLNFIKNLQIPLPSLPEQQAIVNILDDAFARIDTAIANTKQNMANAKELFDSYLNSVFEQKGEDWEETTLGNEISLFSGFSFKSSNYSNNAEDIKLLRGDNIIQGALRWEGVKRWSSETLQDYEKFLLKKDDIVLAMDRTWIKAGVKFACITELDLPCLLVQRVACLRVKDSITPYFLRHLIASPLFSKYILSIQGGLGVPHISGKQINAFSFNRPPLPEQERIIARLDALSEHCTKLEAKYKAKLEALQELKQSILEKAFSGELTAEMNFDEITA